MSWLMSSRITRLRVEWKVQDLWVGVFWKTGYATTDNGQEPFWTDIWVCLLPCLPFHVTVMHQIVIDMAGEAKPIQ